MRYIVFMLYAGMAGTDSAQFVEFEDYITDTDLNEESWQRALNHAAKYGVYPMCEMPEDYDEEESDSDSWINDSYSESIEGYWEKYDPEKHDGLRVGNGPAFKHYQT